MRQATSLIAVANLLNPCHCKSGGICKCCEPKREKIDHPPSPVPSTSSGSHTPNGERHLSDKFIEMFASKATTGQNHTPPSRSGPTWAQLMIPDNMISPENPHHPAHTSRHVHKTKLYSPYTPGHSTPRHGRRPSDSGIGWASATRPKVKPIADMTQFLGAVFKDDGSVAQEIPRSALGLPGIQTFDSAAEKGGVKIEGTEVDAPVSFPTQDDVVIGACTCGDDCDCPGCAIHGNSPNGHACGDHCSSTFDCADHLSFPRGISSIEHMLSIAAANVPHPPRHRSTDLAAHDTSILPPSVKVSEDAARTHGVIPLRRLECCNGRCQCPPGNCSCKEDCCGCCVRCACDEEGDTNMDRGSGSCCSTKVPVISPPIPPETSSLSIVAPTPVPGRVDPSLLSPASAVTEQPVAGPSTLRRSSSSHSKSKSPVPLGRRATVGSQSTGTNSPSHRSMSTGKAASKSLALHQIPQHPHAHGRPHMVKAPHAHPPGHIRRPSSTGSGHHTPTERSTTGSSQEPTPAASTGFSLRNFHNDSELMAYINSLSSPNYDLNSSPLTMSSERNPMSAAAVQQVNPFDMLGQGGGPMSDQELLDLVTQAMNQSQSQDQAAALGPAFQYPYSYPYPTGNIPEGYVDPPVSDSMGLPFSVADLCVRTNISGAETAGPPPPAQPVAQTLPPSSAAFLQGLLSQQQTKEDGNPNLIDLSKPLTANDVERILRALQTQGGSPQEAGPSKPEQAAAPTAQPPNASLFNPLVMGFDQPQGDTTYNGTQSNGNGNLDTTYTNGASQHGTNGTLDSGDSANAEIDELFSNFVFDPNLLRDANGEVDLENLYTNGPAEGDVSHEMMTLPYGLGGIGKKSHESREGQSVGQ